MNAFKLPRFYPIIDTAFLTKTNLSAIKLAEESMNAGVQILQYRHKAAWKQENFDDAKLIAKICRDAGALFIINDRADYARLLNAGLHVGQDDIPPVAARRVLSSAILGFSTHNGSQLRRAKDEPADYLSLGPIFATNSKLRPDPVVGLDGLRALKILTEKPLVAIGGITLENCADVLANGADSVAVISGVLTSSANGSLRQTFEDWITQTKDS